MTIDHCTEEIPRPAPYRRPRFWVPFLTGQFLVLLLGLFLTWALSYPSPLSWLDWATASALCVVAYLFSFAGVQVVDQCHSHVKLCWWRWHIGGAFYQSHFHWCLELYLGPATVYLFH